MGLFGKNEEKAAENAAMKVEYARLESLSLLALAAEILVRVWQPEDGSDPRSPSLTEISKVLNPARSIFGIDEEVRGAFSLLLSEGLQVLEQARLIVPRFSGGDHASLGWALTRAGRAALAAPDAEQRIADALAPLR